MQRVRFCFSKDGKGLGGETCTSTTSARTSPEGARGCECSLGNGVVAEQDVPVRLPLVPMLSSAAGSGCLVNEAWGLVTVAWYVMFLVCPVSCVFPEPPCLQGTSSNFLVLRIEATEQLGSVMLRVLASSGREGLRKWLLS